MLIFPKTGHLLEKWMDIHQNSINYDCKRFNTWVALGDLF